MYWITYVESLLGSLLFLSLSVKNVLVFCVFFTRHRVAISDNGLHRSNFNVSVNPILNIPPVRIRLELFSFPHTKSSVLYQRYPRLIFLTLTSFQFYLVSPSSSSLYPTHCHIVSHNDTTATKRRDGSSYCFSTHGLR